MSDHKTNIFAILSLIFAFIFFPLGFVFGLIALNQIKKTHEEGKGLAIAGVIFSSMSIVGMFIIISTLGLFLGTFATGFDEGLNRRLKTTNSIDNIVDDTESNKQLSKDLSIKLIEKKTFIQVGQSFGDSLLGKKAQGKFLVLTLEIENTGKEPIYVSTNDVRLFDAEGRKYVPDTEAMIYYHDSFIFETINPGIKSRGAVIFDVPDPNKEFKLEVSNNVLSLFD